METTMSLLTRFRRATPSRPRRIAQPAWVAGGPPETADAGDDPAADAGSWFDSSWVLRSGVLVTEHATLDPVANDLPLGWWLDGPGATLVSPSSPPSR
jgi:hypothetical protein